MIVCLTVDFSRDMGRWMEYFSMAARYVGEVDIYLEFEGTMSDMNDAIDSRQVVVEVPDHGKQLVTRNMILAIQAVKQAAA